MAEGIEMSFGEMGRVTQGRAVSIGVAFLKLEVAILGVDIGRPVVTSGDLVAWL